MAMIVGVFAVLQVGMRKRKQAIDVADALAQARAEKSLDALAPARPGYGGWLAVEWAAWAAAGYPSIP
jgi:hypothetical protein